MTNGTGEMEKNEVQCQTHLTRKVITTAYLEIEGWLEKQPARRQAIYRSRLGDPEDRLTFRSLAAQFGISRERIRQVENNLIRDLGNYSAATEDGPVAMLARALAREAGTLIPETELTNMLRPCPATPSHALAALQLAGDYRKNKGWYHRQDSEQHNPTDRIKTEVAQRRLMSVEEATSSLVEWGMNPRYVLQWLDCQTRITRKGEFLLNLKHSMADQAYITLRRLGKPATIPDIARLIYYEGAPSILRNVMTQQGLFSKCTRDKYGLKEWGLPRYESMPKAIREALTGSGGAMPLKELQEVLAHRFEVPPERTARWVEQISGVLRRDGQISLGTSPAAAAPNIIPPLGKGLFRISDRQAAVVAPVTAKMLTSSETRLSKTVTRVMRLCTDRRYHFALGDGTTIRLSHYQKRLIPALVGLRHPLQALGAREGDIASIFLDLQSETAQLQLTNQEEITPGWQAVARLTGINPAAGREGLAEAMMCQTTEIEHMLRLRKDWTVLQALP